MSYWLGQKNQFFLYHFVKFCLVEKTLTILLEEPYPFQMSATIIAMRVLFTMLRNSSPQINKTPYKKEKNIPRKTEKFTS